MTIEESAWEDNHSCVLTLRINYPPKPPKIKISPPVEMTNQTEDEQNHYELQQNSGSESDCSSPLYYGVADNSTFNGGQFGEKFLEIKRSASACTTTNNKLNKVTTTTATTTTTTTNISAHNNKGRMSENTNSTPTNGVQLVKREVNKTHANAIADLESKLGSRIQTPGQLKIPTSQPPEAQEQDLLSPHSAPPGSNVNFGNLHQSQPFNEKSTAKNKKNKTNKPKRSESEKKGSGSWSWKRPWSIFVRPSSSNSSEEKQAKRSQSFSAAVMRKTNSSKLPQQSLYKLEHHCSFQLSTDIAALKQEFSYHSITREEANTLLSKYEFGTYLLRPNSTCTDFCLSYVVSPERIEHTQINREHVNDEEKFVLSGKSTKRYNSLLEIVDMGRTKGFDIVSDSGSRMTFFLLSPPSKTALRDKSAADHNLMIMQ